MIDKEKVKGEKKKVNGKHVAFDSKAQFAIGQLIHHRRFRYRGVIVDVDPNFQLTEDWYDEVAVSRPPKDRPWYHILVHNSDQTTYVAERHLEPDHSSDPINHPLLNHCFDVFDNGRYDRSGAIN